MPITFPTLSVATPQRRRTYAVLRSLIRTSNTPPAFGALPGQQEDRGRIVINFPSMPDTIELARKANYTNQLATPVTPDGLHLYDHTEPLTVPISFNLHSYDEDYCQRWGPLMLLSVAARLHALTLPILSSTDRTTLASAAPPKGVGEDEAALRKWQEQTGTRTLGNSEKSGFFQFHAGDFSFPPACSLNIMLAQLGGSSGLSRTSNDGQHSLGINCIGFVSDVRVVFKGPWLQGDFGSDGLRNLPSEAEFSFTFVHQPDYVNKFIGKGANLRVAQASAADVYRRLYNTQDLVGDMRAGGYSGLFDFEASSVPAALAPAGMPFQTTRIPSFAGTP